MLQGNKKECVLYLPFWSVYLKNWEYLTCLLKNVLNKEAFQVPRELEGISVQLIFSPNNEELGIDKEGGAQVKGCTESGFVFSVTSGSPNSQLLKYNFPGEFSCSG